MWLAEHKASQTDDCQEGCGFSMKATETRTCRHVKTRHANTKTIIALNNAKLRTRHTAGSITTRNKSV
eukprot:scaffold370073_cov19-Prasinocladus_malaysianus.AAC.1